MPSNNELKSELDESGENLFQVFRFSLLTLGLFGTALSFSPTLFGVETINSFIKSRLFLTGTGFFFTSVILSSIGLYHRFSSHLPSFDLPTETLGGVTDKRKRMKISIRRINYLSEFSQLCLSVGFLFVIVAGILMAPVEIYYFLLLPITAGIFVWGISFDMIAERLPYTKPPLRYSEK